MRSIDHDVLERQACACRWHFNAPTHHDVWLGKLKKLDLYSITSLVRENEEQSRCPTLPIDLIPTIDIHDFALEHANQLTNDALKVAEGVRYLAGRAMLPLRVLQVDAVLVDSKTRG